MTPQQYHRAINAATLQGFDALADVLLILFAYDYPAEVPQSVLSRRGTRLTTVSTVLEKPIKG